MPLAIPLSSQDTANRETSTGAIIETIQGYIRDYIDSCLPVVVKRSYNADNNTVDVQPLIKTVTIDNNSHSRATLINIQVLNIGNSMFSVRVNPQVGDLGYIIACDMDTVNFNRDLTESIPNTYSRYQNSFGVFIPCNFEKNLNTTAPMTITNSAQTVKIELFSDRIELTASNIIMNGNVTVKGDFVGSTVKTQAGISLDDHVHIGSPTAPTGGVSNTGIPE